MRGIPMRLALCAAALGGSATTAVAQDTQNVYYRQVRDYLERSETMRQLSRVDFRHRDSDAQLGYFRVGSNFDPYVDVTFYLESGFEYAIVGKCDEDCMDMDFKLYDPSGDLVDSDTGPDYTPGVTTIPRRGGNYTLRVSLPRCNAPVGCYWIAQPFWRSR